MPLTLIKKKKTELVDEVLKLRVSLDKCYNQLHILSKGRTDIFSDNIQNLYYSIANLTLKSVSLDQLYQDIHSLLKKVINVNNFIIAVYDNKSSVINFPYYIDENLDGLVQSFKRKASKGLTEYNLSVGKPLFLYEEDIHKLVEEKKVVLLSKCPKIWMGVPLKHGEKIIGLIGIKSYNHRNKYNTKHLDMLDFISGQIAIAIERKQNEEKLNFQNARIKTIFESSSHLMWSVNKSLALTTFNHNYSDAIAMLHKTIPTLNQPPDSLDKMLSKNDYLNFVLSKYQQTFEGNPQHFETSNILPNGKEIWWEIFLNPIYQTDGNVEEVSGIAHDITEKKIAEMALQESEEKFRDIFESFQDIYYRTNLDGVILMISPSVKELLGYSPSEVIGKKLSDFYEVSFRERNVSEELLLIGYIKNYERSIKSKYGTIIPTISNVRIVYNRKNIPIAIEGVARDISSIKQTSEELRNAKDLAEKSLKVKQLFLANMSHEIRTPMNGIIGMIDLLNNSDLNLEQKDYVTTIKRSSETLLHILNDILDLSKLEAGKMQLRPTPISIDSTIEKLFALFQNLANSKNITLEYELDENVPQYINADETRFLQILSNLTSNAIKFTEKGGVSIIVKKAGKKRIKFIVKDTGIGITRENVKSLFNSFSQVDDSSSKSYGGTGLGLSISKEMAKLMGGTIGVKSEIGKGSTFWFTIEGQPVDKIELLKKINEEEEDYFKGFGNIIPKVLLVDDNQINQKVASEILKKAGCEVHVAGNGMEAIIKVIEYSYDIIFMDIQMPEMDGMTATKKIKELRIKKLAPIIAMTAYSMEDDKERFLNAGMDDYLPKPINSESIVKIIRKWVLKIDENDKIEPVKNKFSDKIINFEVVEQLKIHLDSDMISEVYEEFETETETLLNACKSTDWDIIKSNLHTLKGNASTLGIDQIASISTLIELNIKKKNISNYEKDLFNLSVSFDNYKKAYKELLNLEKNVSA